METDTIDAASRPGSRDSKVFEDSKLFDTIDTEGENFQKLQERVRYGTMPSVGKTDLERRKDDLDKKWEQEYASSWALLLNALGIAGYQAFSMVLVMYQVLFHKRYVMQCDGRLSATTRWACEYTKAYARFFPLVALTISLSLVSSMIMIQRMYYELLRRGALLRLKQYKVQEQPFFFIMVVCLVHAAANLAIDALTPGGEYLIDVTEPMEIPDKLEEAKQWLFYLVAPIAAFILSVYFTYDPAYFLVPLNKYVEDVGIEEVEEAKQRINSLIVLDEDDVANICRTMDFHAFAKDDNTSDITEDLYMEIIHRANHKSGSNRGSFMEDAASSHIVQGLQGGMKSAILDRFWPADFLLHPKLRDEGSRQFQFVSRMFNILCIVVSGICCYIFLWFAIRDFQDVSKGEHEDISALIVEAMHFFLAAMYVRRLVSRALQCR